MIGLIIDTNLGLEHARGLGRRDKVYYYVDARNPYPRMQDTISGWGFEEIEKIDDIGEVLGEVDYVVFCDVGYGALADKMREAGLSVWGASEKGEQLEIDRIYGRRISQMLGIGVPDAEIVKGVDGVIEYMRNHRGQRHFVKLSFFRGSIETFSVKYEDEARMMLSQANFGIMQDEIDFVVEKEMKGVEIGADFWITDEGFCDTHFFTIEFKGMGCIGKFVKDSLFKEQFMDKLEDWLIKTGYRGNISIEGFWDGKEFRAMDYCYSEDTEVLTREGWKFIKDVRLGDEVLSINPDSGLWEYVRIVDKFEKEVDKVVRIGGKRSIEMLVSEDHPVFVQNWKGEYLKIRAKELLEERKTWRYKVPFILGRWIGADIEKIRIPAYRKEWISGKSYALEREYIVEEKEVNAKKLLRFLGLYVAEGSMGSYYNGKPYVIQISQSKSNKRYEEVKKVVCDLAEELGVNVSEEENGFRISSVQLVSYLESLKIGKKASEKRVPEFVKLLSSELIEEFLYGFWLGDGSEDKGRIYYATSSKKLADDLQELILKCGDVAFIKTEKKKGTKMKVRDKEYERTADIYVLERRRRNKSYCLDRRWAEIERIAGKRKVYDIQLERNHLMFVRRNGRVWIGSNCCRFPYPNSMIFPRAIENYNEFIYGIGTGEIVEPKVNYQYWVEYGVYTDDPDIWRRVEFDRRYEDLVGFRRAVKKNGEVYAVAGDYLIAVGMGFGDTWEEAEWMGKRVVEKISAFNVASYTVSFREIIDELRDYGAVF